MMTSAPFMAFIAALEPCGQKRKKGVSWPPVVSAIANPREVTHTWYPRVPAESAWSHGKESLCKYVVATGAPRNSASAFAWSMPLLMHTPPPARMTGLDALWYAWEWNQWWRCRMHRAARLVLGRCLNPWSGFIGCTHGLDGIALIVETNRTGGWGLHTSHLAIKSAAAWSAVAGPADRGRFLGKRIWKSSSPVNSVQHT